MFVVLRHFGHNYVCTAEEGLEERKGNRVGVLRLHFGVRLARGKMRFTIGGLRWFFGIDWCVPRIVVFREHLMTRACYHVLLLVGCSRVGCEESSVEVLLPSGLCVACPLYGLWSVLGMIMIVVSPSAYR